MPRAIVLTGLPVTGKTTYAKELEKKGYVRVSPDPHVDTILKDNNKKSLNEIISDVEKLFKKEVMKVLNKKLDVVFDTDLLTMEERRDIIKRLHSRRYSIASVYFELPEDNESISKYIGAVGSRYPNMTTETMMEMMNELVVPTTGEGFSMVTVYPATF